MTVEMTSSARQMLLNLKESEAESKRYVHGSAAMLILSQACVLLQCCSDRGITIVLQGSVVSASDDC